MNKGLAGNRSDDAHQMCYLLLIYKRQIMATIVIKSHSEYNSIRSLLRVAIMKSDTYEDKYIRVIVRNAQRIVNEPDFKNCLTSDEYRFSTALTSMRTEELFGFQSERLGKDDFVKLLQFFDNL